MTEAIDPQAAPCDSLAARLAASIAEASAERREFVVSPQRRVAYTELATFIRRFAGLVRTHELQLGDRVTVFTADSVLGSLLAVAVVRLGLTLVMGDAHAPSAEITRLVSASDPALVLVDAEILTALHAEAPDPRRLVALGESFEALLAESESLPAPAAIDGASIATIVFTSGTTAQSRGVMLTQANIAAQMRTFDAVYGFDERSRIANGLPLHHVDGLVRGPLAAAWAGATLHRTPQLTTTSVPDLLRTIAAERVTHLVSVPAMLRVIDRVAPDERAPFAHPEFRFVISSADVLDESLWRRFEQRFGVRVVNAYGLSEVVCDALFSGPSDGSRRVGSLGRPHGCEIRVVTTDGADVALGGTGVLQVRGPSVTIGYFRDDAATQRAIRDGWLDTGDRVTVDEAGFVHFAGRAKTAIVSRGVTIQPEPLAAALAAVDGVAEASVIGVPDELRGERVVACVAADGSRALTRENVLAICRELFAPELRPTDAFVLGALPRGPAGKIRVGELAEEATALIAARATATEGAVDPYSIAAACFGVDRAKLHAESNPFNTGGWDSLAHLAFINRLEQALGTTLSAIEIMDLVSLADAERIVARHRPGDAPAPVR